MSRTDPTRLEVRALDLFCGKCGAAPDCWCTTKSGWSGMLHANRINRAVAIRRKEVR